MKIEIEENESLEISFKGELFKIFPYVDKRCKRIGIGVEKIGEDDDWRKLSLSELK